MKMDSNDCYVCNVKLMGNFNINWFMIVNSNITLNDGLISHRPSCHWSFVYRNPLDIEEFIKKCDEKIKKTNKQ